MHQRRFKCLLRNKNITLKDMRMDQLDYFYPGRLDAPNFSQETIVKEEVDVMLIIPVYNVGDYLTECIESILNQKTKYSYTALFVNDGSTDKSQDILNSYKTHKKIKIIHQTNHGVSEARNVGLREIVGKYVMFVDADDILANDAIEKLLDVAYENSADIVEGSFVSFDSKGKKNCFYHVDDLKTVKSTDLFGYAWGKIISSEILKNICFPSGYLYEDTIMSTIIHPLSRKTCTISDVVYFYRLNEFGIDASTITKHQVIDSFWLTKYCLEEAFERKIEMTPERQKQYYDQFRLNWIRLKMFQEEIQESVFSVYCDLYEKYFLKNLVINKPEKYYWMQQTLQYRSYDAYNYLMNHWDELD